MVVGHILTELHSFLYRISHVFAGTQLPHVWLSKSYTSEWPIALEWYIKELCDTMLVIIILACACLSQKKPSFNIFCIFGIYLLYGIFDLFSFAYNNKHGDIKYWVLLAISTIGVLLIIFPIKKPSAKIIKMFAP